MAWQHVGDDDLTHEQEWPTVRVWFEDPRRFRGWRLWLTYVALYLPADAPLHAPFPVQLVEVAVRRYADVADAPPLTPPKLRRLDVERAFQQAQQVAEDRLSGTPGNAPRLPAGYPHRGPQRDRWYEELIVAVSAYKAAGVSAMDAYRHIAERKNRDVGTVKRWVFEGRRVCEEDDR